MMLKVTTSLGLISVLFLSGFNLTSEASFQAHNQAGEAAALFALAATKHKRELVDLWKLRGMPLIHLSDVSSESITRILATRDNRNSYEALYPENTGVLFYSYARNSLSIWLLDGHGIRAYDQQEISEEQLAAGIANLRGSLGVDSLRSGRIPHKRGLRVGGNIEGHSSSVNQARTDLTNVLLPTPIAQALSSVKHLIVVPTLGIGTVPYALLKPFNSESFLIDLMSISIAPSLFDVGQSMETWDPNFLNPLIVGNPDLAPESDWVVPPLPGAEMEARAIATAINAKPLLGKEATKQAVLMKAPESDFLYFATHGVASSDDPLSGGFLLLSAPEFNKGRWTAKEVQGTKLHASIAVLSACQTGLGKVHDAGVVGLARAFQLAGVPRIVMSLWSVNDSATNELMQAFVKNMRNNIPSEALRLSMVEIRKKRPDPSLWASFVLFGTPR